MNHAHVQRTVEVSESAAEIINGFTTALAVLHLVTLTIKDGSLHGSERPSSTVTWKLKVPGLSQ